MTLVVMWMSSPGPASIKWQATGDIEIELTYVVKFVNGAALMDDVLN